MFYRQPVVSCKQLDTLINIITTQFLELIRLLMHWRAHFIAYTDWKTKHCYNCITSATSR